MNQQPSNHDRVQNYSQDELRAMIENEEAVDGGTHPAPSSPFPSLCAHYPVQPAVLKSRLGVPRKLLQS